MPCYEHIRNTSTCRESLIENELQTGGKTSITKAIKKIHIELGRKGENVIKFGTCAPRRRHRRRGYHRLRELPWGVRGLNHMLGTPALRSDRGKMNPYSWFENLWDLQRGCEKLMLLLKRTHTLAYFWEQGK